MLWINVNIMNRIVFTMYFMRRYDICSSMCGNPSVLWNILVSECQGVDTILQNVTLTVESTEGNLV